MSHIIREIGASILWKFDLQDTFQTIYWYRYRSHDYNVLQFHTNEFSNCFNTCSSPLCYNLCCPPGYYKVQWELVCSISLFVRICDIQYNAISIVVLSNLWLFVLSKWYFTLYHNHIELATTFTFLVDLHNRLRIIHLPMNLIPTRREVYSMSFIW